MPDGDEGWVVVDAPAPSKGKQPKQRAEPLNISTHARTPPSPPGSSGSDTPPYTGSGKETEKQNPEAGPAFPATPPPTPPAAAGAAPGIHDIKRIGAYSVGRKLGEGAFAVVRKGMHLHTKVSVALKLIDKLAIQEEYLKENIGREEEILRHLHHPSIIKLLEVIETSSVLCLVLEMCPVDVLSHLCDNGVMAETTARRYGRQLLSAFEYMHQRGVVHRDLKMENLMLDHDGNMVVIDFGLANIISSADGWLDTQCGSMAYSAPELLGSKRYGKAVDVWGIGVCLYVMLTGTLPFGNPSSLTELHALALDGIFDLPDHMSEAARDLFVQIFQFKPQKRITLEQLWAHPWFTGFTDDRSADAHAMAAATAAGESTANPAAPRRPPADFDYTLKLADLDMKCISMATKMAGVSESAIVRSVLENVRDSASATYFLLVAEAEHKFRQQKAQAAKEAEARERRLSFPARSPRKGSSTGGRGGHSSNSRAPTALRRRTSSMSSDEDPNGGRWRADRSISARPRMGSNGSTSSSDGTRQNSRDRSGSYSGRTPTRPQANQSSRLSHRRFSNNSDEGGRDQSGSLHSNRGPFAPSPTPPDLPSSAFDSRRSARARSSSVGSRATSAAMRRSHSDSSSAGGAGVRDQVGRMRDRSGSGSARGRGAPPSRGGEERRRRNSIGSLPEPGTAFNPSSTANLPPLRGGGGNTNGDVAERTRAPPIGGAFRQYETTVVL